MSTASPSPAATSLTLSVFVALSSGLTGVSAGQLNPLLDPIDIAGQFYDAVRTGVPDPELLNRLANLFLSEPTPAEGAAAVLADPVVGPVGRSILKLWLLGSWYGPAEPARAIRIISAQAYKESQVWRAIQAHPTEQGRFTFDHWSTPPSDFDRLVSRADA